MWRERALAVLWNPVNASVQANVTLPLTYAGLARPQRVRVWREEGAGTVLALDGDISVSLVVQLAPMGITYFVVEEVVEAQ
jgi:hypothetical protein